MPKLGIEFDEEAQKKLEVPLGKRELYPTVGKYVAEVLREHGITIAWGVPGGHIWHFVDAISRIGIKLIVLHSQVGGPRGRGPSRTVCGPFGARRTKEDTDDGQNDETRLPAADGAVDGARPRPTHTGAERGAAAAVGGVHGPRRACSRPRVVVGGAGGGRRDAALTGAVSPGRA